MKLWNIILGLLTLAIGFLVWFLYRMSHPSPQEPKWLLQIRGHPTALGEYLTYLAYGLFHPYLLRRGATRAESAHLLPGDELVAKPRWRETRAITINAPPQEVWPWVVQMGGGRAGWYWWVPLSVHPKYQHLTFYTDEILPQFQHLDVGDTLSDGGPYATEQRGNWSVVSIIPNSHLVLYAGRQMSGNDADFDPRIQQTGKGLWFVCSWAFVLEPTGAQGTRLLVRVRSCGGPAWIFPLLILVAGKGDRVAQSNMLRAIKERAERRHTALLQAGESCAC